MEKNKQTNKQEITHVIARHTQTQIFLNDRWCDVMCWRSVIISIYIHSRVVATTFLTVPCRSVSSSFDRLWLGHAVPSSSWKKWLGGLVAFAVTSPLLYAGREIEYYIETVSRRSAQAHEHLIVTYKRLRLGITSCPAMEIKEKRARLGYIGTIIWDWFWIEFYFVRV